MINETLIHLLLDNISSVTGRNGSLNDTQIKNILNRFLELKNFENEFQTGVAATNTLDHCENWMYIVDILYWYYVPIVILVGLIGNFLSCLVFLNTHLKLRSSSYYLAALSAADFGFLASVSFVWLNNKFGIPIFNQNGWCQAIVYTSSVCSFLSVWLIVAFTVERFIAVQYPLHRPRMCTISRAKTTVSILTGISLLIHFYAFLTAGIISTLDGDVCELKDSFHQLMRIINIFDTFITLIIPIGLILTMNMMITKNLIKFSKKFKNQEDNNSDRIDTTSLHILQSSSSNNSNCGERRNYPLRMYLGPKVGSFHSSNNRLNHDNNNDENNVNDDNNDNHKVQNSINNHQFTVAANLPESQIIFQHIAVKCSHTRTPSGNLLSTRIQRSITKMLLLVSTVFVSLNLPSYCIRLYIFLRFSIWHEEAPEYLWCAQQMFMVLYYTNFSVNFLLYSMYGITFRRCLFQLFRNLCKRKPNQYATCCLR